MANWKIMGGGGSLPKIAYESYMNPEPGSQSGPGDSVDADSKAPCLLVTKSSPPSGGAQKNR